MNSRRTAPYQTIDSKFPVQNSSFSPRVRVCSEEITGSIAKSGLRKAPARRRRLGLRGLGLLALFLGGTAFAGQSISLSWNPSTTTNTTGYALYRGTTSGSYPDRIDVGTNTTVTLAGLKEGQTNYFTVAAYNAARVEGTPSSQIAFIVPGVMAMLPKSAPGNPMQLKFPVAPGHSYDIQASVDLKTWSTISSTASATSNAWVTFTDPQSSAFQKRFYRLVLH